MGSAPPGAGGAGTFAAPDSIVRDEAAPEPGKEVLPSWAAAGAATRRSATTPFRPHDRASAPLKRPLLETASAGADALSHSTGHRRPCDVALGRPVLRGEGFPLTRSARSVTCLFQRPRTNPGREVPA